MSIRLGNGKVRKDQTDHYGRIIGGGGGGGATVDDFVDTDTIIVSEDEETDKIRMDIAADITAKIDNSLQTPLSTPIEIELVGIGTDKAQKRIKVDDNTLEIDENDVLKVKEQTVGAFSYVGMLAFNTLDTEEELQEIFGENTSWSLLASKMPIGENVFGNGKTLGVTEGTHKGVIFPGDGARVIAKTAMYGNDLPTTNIYGEYLNDLYGIGVVTKNQLDNAEEPYSYTGLEMESITINIWKRTA